MTTAICIPKGSVEEWAHIVRGEYDESPGLALTRAQAKRLWSIDDDTCDAVLKHLTAIGFLRLNARRMFVRNDAAR